MDRVNQKLDQKSFFESMPWVINFVFPCRPLTRSPSEYGEKEAVTAGGGRDDERIICGTSCSSLTRLWLGFLTHKSSGMETSSRTGGGVSVCVWRVGGLNVSISEKLVLAA